MNIRLPVSSLLQLPHTVHSTSHRTVDPKQWLVDRGWKERKRFWQRDCMEELSLEQAVRLQIEIENDVLLVAMGITVH